MWAGRNFVGSFMGWAKDTHLLLVTQDESPAFQEVGQDTWGLCGVLCLGGWPGVRLTNCRNLWLTDFALLPRIWVFVEIFEFISLLFDERWETNRYFCQQLPVLSYSSQILLPNYGLENNWDQLKRLSFFNNRMVAKGIKNGASGVWSKCWDW